MAELKKGIDSRTDTYTCIKNIYKYLIKVADDMSEGDGITEEMMEGMEREAKDYADAQVEEWMGDISERAIEEMKADGSSDKIRKDIFDRKLSRLIKRAEDALSDKIGSLIDREHMDALSKAVKYESDDISDSLKKDIKDLEDSDYYEEKLDKHLSVSSSQRDISWRKALSSEGAKQEYREGKLRMKPQISKLRKKIDLYGNTQKHNIYNQKRGILNKRQLHKIPMGMNDLFMASIVKEDKPLDICILVDESGSMGYHTMQQARDSAIAIKEALSDNEKINLWVYGHSADETKKGMTEMMEYHSPTMQDRPFAMGGMKARYENRDGNAIISSALKVKGESDNQANKLMIVLSDGSPSADAYRADRARNHTKRAVKYVEGMGWSVIQVGFSGAYEWMMSEMFTNHLYVNDTAKLGDTLTKLIRKVVKV